MSCHSSGWDSWLFLPTFETFHDASGTMKAIPEGAGFQISFSWVQCLMRFCDKTPGREHLSRERAYSTLQFQAIVRHCKESQGGI